MEFILEITLVLQLPSSHQAEVRQLTGSQQAVVRQLSGSCQAVVRQFSDNFRAVITQSDLSILLRNLWDWELVYYIYTFTILRYITQNTISIFIFRYQRAYGIYEEGVQPWKSSVLDCGTGFTIRARNWAKNQEEGQRNLGVSVLYSN